MNKTTTSSSSSAPVLSLASLLRWRRRPLLASRDRRRQRRSLQTPRVELSRRRRRIETRRGSQRLLRLGEFCPTRTPTMVVVKEEEITWTRRRRRHEARFLCRILSLLHLPPRLSVEPRHVPPPSNELRRPRSRVEFRSHLRRRMWRVDLFHRRRLDSRDRLRDRLSKHVRRRRRRLRYQS